MGYPKWQVHSGLARMKAEILSSLFLIHLRLLHMMIMIMIDMMMMIAG
jgi:hypothetical protein